MGHLPMSSAPGTAPPAGPGKSVAVTALGVITLLVGGAYAALGGQLIVAGVSWARRAGEDPWGPVATLFGLGPALLFAVGAAFLSLGLLGLLGGLGVLWRQLWGRVLTFLLAVLAILLGLVWVSGGPGATDIALGAAQILYSILAFVILIGKGAEFFQPEGAGNTTSTSHPRRLSVFFWIGGVVLVILLGTTGVRIRLEMLETSRTENYRGLQGTWIDDSGEDVSYQFGRGGEFYIRRKIPSSLAPFSGDPGLEHRRNGNWTREGQVIVVKTENNWGFS